MSKRLFYLLIGLLFFSQISFAEEQVGLFKMDSIFLRPELMMSEDKGGDFGLSDSSAAFEWRKDKKLSAYFEIGNERNRNLPIYYNNTEVEDRLNFTKAYAEYEGVYGTIQLGLVPLNFGYDGQIRNEDRIFSRSLVFSEKMIGLADKGLSFSTENNGYYTQITAHNGEIDTESDGRLWVTGNWGFTNQRHIRAQMSLQTGSVKGKVSDEAPSNDKLGIVSGENEKWRSGLLFVNWFDRNWNVVLQTGGGNFEQRSATGNYTTNLFEVTHEFSKNFEMGLRYDDFDPRTKVHGDKETDISVAFVFKSLDSTSKVILIGTKSYEESHEIPDDQVRLAWVLTPYTR
jgi:hypothetical protein